jgi:hypothetical protein
MTNVALQEFLNLDPNKITDQLKSESAFKRALKVFICSYIGYE